MNSISMTMKKSAEVSLTYKYDSDTKKHSYTVSGNNWTFSTESLEDAEAAYERALHANGDD